MLQQTSNLKHNIQDLYKKFKLFDQTSKGYLNKQQFKSLFRNFGQELRQSQCQTIMSFQDFLTILSDTEMHASPSCYIHLFASFLQQQQKIYEKEQIYEKALAIQVRKQALLKKQYQRRLLLLKQAETIKLKQFNRAVINQIRQFDEGWKQHMLEFQKQSCDILSTAKRKQLILLRNEYQSLRKNPNQNLKKNSKQCKELQKEQRNLVIDKEYKQAIMIRDYLQQLRIKAAIEGQCDKHKSEIKQIHLLKKNHNTVIFNLKDKIQLQRSIQFKSKKQINNQLMIQTKSLTKNFIHQMKEEEKELINSLNEEFKKLLPENKKIATKLRCSN